MRRNQLKNRPKNRQPKKDQTMGPKPLVASKTIWVNILGGLVTILTAVGEISFVPQSWVPWLVGGLAAANLLLRLVTERPISGVVSAK